VETALMSTIALTSESGGQLRAERWKTKCCRIAHASIGTRRAMFVTLSRGVRCGA
jgi:hypothetical protein